MKKLFMFFLFLLCLSTIAFARTDYTIKVGVLPILDSLPVYVALEKGYFKGKGIEVEAIPCASAAERDQLLSAGALDIIINDLIALALFNKDRINLVGIRYAMLPQKDHPQFYILSSKKSGINSPKGLKNVPIGISEATIIHYVTERLLEKNGLKKEEIKVIPIQRIPDRLSALEKGEIDAATLPDPLAILALMKGASLVLDDSKERGFSGSIYSVRKEFLQKNMEATKAFLLSINKAIEDINKDKAKWANLIVEKKLVPPVLLNSFKVPPYPSFYVPDKKKWEDVILWLKDRGLVKTNIPYNESIMDISRLR
ncbi:MAG TPA: MetQ/NlpA family ABC transporter substrate-binding protein [Syntrophorhabdaceae bacterium]|nr:MetQ/NlpA family ABC transporter substrate-binding protein [Syntrophorhabdaceae bacterium]